MIRHPGHPDYCVTLFNSVALGPVASLVSSVLGTKKSPTVSTAAVTDTQAEQKKAKTARSALLQTEGGISGAELSAGQVSTRDTLFNN